MIKVTVYKTVNHDYAGLDVLGHAGYSEAGSDVVYEPYIDIIFKEV